MLQPKPDIKLNINISNTCIMVNVQVGSVKSQAPSFLQASIPRKSKYTISKTLRLLSSSLGPLWLNLNFFTIHIAYVAESKLYVPRTKFSLFPLVLVTSLAKYVVTSIFVVVTVNFVLLMVVTTNFVISNDQLTDFSSKILKGSRLDCIDNKCGAYNT